MFPLVLLAVAVIAVTTVSSDLNFAAPIEKKSVTEGDEVSLVCQEATRFDKEPDCPSFNVNFLYWKRIGNNIVEYLTQCGRVENQFKDRMTASKDDGLYTLTIQKVRREDAGVYECLLHERINSIDKVKGAVALTVNAQPSGNSTAQPNCEVHPEVPSVGTIAKLACRLPPHAAPTQLTWLESGSHPLVSPGPTTLTSPGEGFILHLYITEHVRNKEFTCVAGRDPTDGPSCTVLPLRGLTNVSATSSPSPDSATSSPSPDSTTVDCVLTGSVVKAGGAVGGLLILLLAIAVVITCVKVKKRSSGSQRQIAQSQQATLAGLDISSQPNTSRYEDAPKAAATRAESLYCYIPNDHKNSGAAASDDRSTYVNINITQGREKRSPRWKLVVPGDLE
ncbi:V-set and immunoglobulin domain-containing protein 1-like [Patiria miniata]|uniref:Ig-like domain-containing protein n=1 Tax=Patiria miniata TaxID=46514 RepID=A0A913ZL15_PATMI|nr:V-set and immunoglobulin domain-containing protein 1-like [Patiria miniata]